MKKSTYVDYLFSSFSAVIYFWTVISVLGYAFFSSAIALKRAFHSLPIVDFWTVATLMTTVIFLILRKLLSPKLSKIFPIDFSSKLSIYFFLSFALSIELLTMIFPGQYQIFIISTKAMNIAVGFFLITTFLSSLMMSYPIWHFLRPKKSTHFMVYLFALNWIGILAIVLVLMVYGVFSHKSPEDILSAYPIHQIGLFFIGSIPIWLARLLFLGKDEYKKIIRSPKFIY